MLDQIKGLPVATESDAGKSVIVNESGEYALGEGSGGSGGGAFIISYDHSEHTVDPSNQAEMTIYVYDKTFAEANEAIRAHIPVYVYTANDDLAVLEYVESSGIGGEYGQDGTLFDVAGKVLMYSFPDMADGKLLRTGLPYGFTNAGSNLPTK